jgi:uncharacterized protein YfkK (UPF0435 family)
MFDQRKLQAQMVLKGVKSEELAEAIGIDTTTYYRRLKNEGNFSRKEMQTIIEFLGIENPQEIFFAESDA